MFFEVEALALSRDIPAGFRWLVDPIVRNVSKSALAVSLRQTEDAVNARFSPVPTPAR